VDDRDFIRRTRDAVFGAQCTLSSDGGIFQDLERIIQSCNDHLAEVREVEGVRFRIYPAHRSDTEVIVEAMVEGHFDDRSGTCRPAQVDRTIRRLLEDRGGP
jgi:predicted nucleotidyltransferase